MFYLDLFKQLNQYQVQYLLIGGLAISMHGIERATMDIDITIAMHPENQENLIAWAPIDDLISLKQAAGRPIDLSDIAHLKRLKG